MDTEKKKFKRERSFRRMQISSKVVMLLILKSSKCVQRCRRHSLKALALLMACIIVCTLRFLFIPGESPRSTNQMGKFEQRIKFFRPTMSEEETRSYKKLLTVFTRAVPANVNYFMYTGTLLGSYRHHSMIPWDDDIDFLVKYQDKPTLFRSLQSLHPEYKMTMSDRSKYLWKFYHRSSTPVLQWGWPFIDVYFYAENKTFIWDLYFLHVEYKYDKKIIFPLTRRPFMGLMLPAPKNSSEFLRKMYDVNVCVGNSYVHRDEANITENAGVQIPCEILKDTYPFVQRDYYDNLTVETLVEGSGKKLTQTFSALP